jgi:hypothetical protein
MKELISSNNILNDIISPQQLLNWMDKNIEYGYLGNDSKIYYTMDAEEFSNKYFLQSPSELIKNKIGVCWDQAELERAIFKKLKIFHIVIYIEQINEIRSTHTFLLYKINDNYYWFENSYEKYRGIHGPYKTINEIILKLHMYMYNDNSDNGFLCHILDRPTYHMNCEEYMKFAKTNRPLNILFKGVDIFEQD